MCIEGGKDKNSRRLYRDSVYFLKNITDFHLAVLQSWIILKKQGCIVGREEGNVLVILRGKKINSFI